MKRAVFILSILFTLQCFGQKWHLNSVNEDQMFPYEYWFQFENAEDTCSYRITKNVEAQKSIIKVIDNRDSNVVFADVRLINIEYAISLPLVFNREIGIQLDNGHYRIEVRANNYDDFNLDFEIENDDQVDLTIKLGLARELEVYQIESKKELSEAQILDIIECVRANRNDFHKTCSDLGKHRIMMHI